MTPASRAARSATSPSWRRCAGPACRSRWPRTSTPSPRSARSAGTTAETVRATYAATLVKRQGHRPTFDTLFDLCFPRMIGGGVAEQERAAADEAAASASRPSRDNADALADLRERLAAALTYGRRAGSRRAGRRGGRPLRRDARPRARAVVVVGLHRAAAGLPGRPRRPDRRRAWSTAASTARPPSAAAGRRVGDFTRRVEDDARRRIAEEKGAEHVADVAVRPSLDRLDFTTARRADLDELRREIYPLARRLASRLTQEQHARRRGPLDVRRTVRASMSTGGVPLVTHHKPRRPHRTELVVLCDVSGSVAVLRALHADAGLRAARAVHRRSGPSRSSTPCTRSPTTSRPAATWPTR